MADDKKYQIEYGPEDLVFDDGVVRFTIMQDTQASDDAGEIMWQFGVEHMMTGERRYWLADAEELEIVHNFIGEQLAGPGGEG